MLVIFVSFYFLTTVSSDGDFCISRAVCSGCCSSGVHTSTLQRWSLTLCPAWGRIVVPCQATRLLGVAVASWFRGLPTRLSQCFLSGFLFRAMLSMLLLLCIPDHVLIGIRGGGERGAQMDGSYCFYLVFCKGLVVHFFNVRNKLSKQSLIDLKLLTEDGNPAQDQATHLSSFKKKKKKKT